MKYGIPVDNHAIWLDQRTPFLAALQTANHNPTDSFGVLRLNLAAISIRGFR
jgi:hypothetical protein